MTTSALRNGRTIRFFVMVAGLNLLAGGALLAGMYSLLHDPSELDKAIDPSLEHVHYAAPHWVLTGGSVLAVAGAALMAIGWVAGRVVGPFRPSDTRCPNLVIASFGVTASASVATALWAGRSGPGLAVIPIAIGVAWVGAIWKFRHTPLA